MNQVGTRQRLTQLIQVATGLFIGQGYRRTQIADVAKALGAAKGTIYLYVESKEALFDLAVRLADQDADPDFGPLPVPAPPPGATLKFVRAALTQRAQLPRLMQAISREAAASVRDELREVLAELYDVMVRNRTGIKLIDRCAPDYPDLAALWFQSGRVGTMGLLTHYLELRRANVRALPDLSIAARLAIENIVLWAVHRHWDPWPQAMDEQVARDMVIDFLVHGLLKEDAR